MTGRSIPNFSQAPSNANVPSTPAGASTNDPNKQRSVPELRTNTLTFRPRENRPHWVTSTNSRYGGTGAIKKPGRENHSNWENLIGKKYGSIINAITKPDPDISESMAHRILKCLSRIDTRSMEPQSYEYLFGLMTDHLFKNYSSLNLSDGLGPPEKLLLFLDKMKNVAQLHLKELKISVNFSNRSKTCKKLCEIAEKHPNLSFKLVLADDSDENFETLDRIQTAERGEEPVNAFDVLEKCRVTKLKIIQAEEDQLIALATPLSKSQVLRVTVYDCPLGGDGMKGVLQAVGASQSKKLNWLSSQYPILNDDDEYGYDFEDSYDSDDTSAGQAFRDLPQNPNNDVDKYDYEALYNTKDASTGEAFRDLLLNPNSSLEELCLSQIPLGNAGGEILAQAFSQPEFRLRKLTLGGTKMDDDASIANIITAAASSTLTHLEELPFGPLAAVAAEDAVSNNLNLTITLIDRNGKTHSYSASL